jgi:hypothetical protein
MKLDLKIIEAAIFIVLIVLYLLIQNNQNNMNDDKQNDDIPTLSENNLPPKPPESTPKQGRVNIKHFEWDFNSFYGVKDGETPKNTTKTATNVPGVELWVIPQSLAQDPVQFHYWLVTGKGKYKMDDENVSQVLTDVNFSPKSESDALAVSKLVFYEPRRRIVEADNISDIRSRVPDNIKDQVSVPKITKEGEYYIVELGVYYHESLRGGGSSDFYTIYRHKIGPSYFKRLSSNVLWMTNVGI